MISSDRMAAVDRNAAALGVPRAQLMESSGHAVGRAVKRLADPGTSVAIVAGRGNNGGDAFAAARFLDDYAVSVSLLGRPESINDRISRANWDALQAGGYDTTTVRDAHALALDDPDVVVDALLGTGISGPPREPEATAIERINATDAPTVAVDVPSGLDADTGATPGSAVDADRVVTFHDTTPGLADHDHVTVADIGIPEAAETVVGPGDLLGVDRDPHGHKGDAGSVLVIGGGPYTGAPALCAQAALRAGADLVRLAVPDAVAAEVQGFDETFIVDSVVGTRLVEEHVPDLLARAEDADAVVIGPGLGDADTTQAAVAAFLAAFEGRAVVDADALTAVPDVETDATLVCTPHRGELQAMGGPTVDGSQPSRDAVEGFAAELGQTLLVTGARDVLSDGDTTRVNRSGTPGMTVGGTGDVLAGATAAMLATQPPIQAASAAAYATGGAGERAADAHGHGLLATDICDALPAAIWGGQDA
ncbi:NAD(P)H-hydrate dehydratase [Halobacterium salinarum]|nr:NAD(P)H-hydrate dehydratase [Halobacterium salinarum]